MAVAAVTAWQARRAVDEDGRTVVAVGTRMRNAELLQESLADLQAQVHVDGGVVTATWPRTQARFTRDASGVWTSHFVGETDPEQAVTIVRNLDKVYGLKVQRTVLERLRQRAPAAGMSVDSETVEQDNTVTLVLTVGR